MTEPAPRLLYRPGDAVPTATAEIPGWAADLRLDEVAPLLGEGELGRRRLGILLRPLPDADAVAYRQEVFRDIETLDLGPRLSVFAASIAEARDHLARAARMRHPAERDRWVLDALDAFDAAAGGLAAELRARDLQSRGMRAVSAYLDSVADAPVALARRSAVASTRAALDAVSFRLHIGEHRVVVSQPRGEPDLAAEIRAAFSRLHDSEAAPLRVDQFATLDMNPIEADVLARVAKLAPAPFAELAATAAAYRDTLDPGVDQIADDAMWFAAVLGWLGGHRSDGRALAYPRIEADGRLSVAGLADLLVAQRLAEAGVRVRGSRLDLGPEERAVIVTGPSQSGRTSFARALAQLHVLAAAGCPVPAEGSVALPLVTDIRTVFDQTERLDDPGGRLRTELRRIRSMLATAGPGTLVIANEPFASTTASDAHALARRLLDALRTRRARIVAVTFLEELAVEPGAVSVAAVADPDDPAARTFAFERRPADGLAQAQLLARRHGLTAADVARRVRR